MEYGAGPQAESILRYYWDHLSMLVISERCYGTPFKGHRGVTQGGRLPPTIFNMVVDTDICHWVMLVEG